MTTVALLKKLLTFRPVTEDLAAVNRLVDFLRGHLHSLGLRTRIERFQGRKILYASTRGRRRVPILLNAHVDVVPADAATFRIRREDDWLCGRGAGDCLGNAAVIARVLDRCRDTADLGAIFTTDEERGGFTTEAMVARGYAGRFIIILDGGGYRIGIAQKGRLGLRLRARGRACHSATPWRGENAAERLLEGYARVKKIFPDVRPGDEWHDTMAPTVLRAGHGTNLIPDDAEMFLDIRFTGRRSADAIVRAVRAASGLEAEVVVRSPAVIGSAAHPRLRALHRFMESRLSREIPFVRSNGATDARHFAKLRAPIAMIGVPARHAHSRDEAVSLQGLREYEDWLADFCATQA